MERNDQAIDNDDEDLDDKPVLIYNIQFQPPNH
jgi:hypothetical protein